MWMRWRVSKGRMRWEEDREEMERNRMVMEIQGRRRMRILESKPLERSKSSQ